MSTPLSDNKIIKQDTAVQFVKGVGPKRAEMLAKLGIFTVQDALYYLPARFEDRANFVHISHIVFGSYQTICGTVTSKQEVTTPRKNMKIFELTISDTSGLLVGVWFNQPFMQRYFKQGQKVILSGTAKYDAYHHRAVIENPEYEILEDDEEKTVHTGRIVPIYRVTAGLSVRVMRSVMKGLVDNFATSMNEFLTPDFYERYQIPPLADAVRESHFPEKEKNLAQLNSMNTRAQKRLIFDEFLLLQLGLSLMKRGRMETKKAVGLYGGGETLGRFYAALPFTLTADQRSVIKQIHADIELEKPMSRLIQGDVGCGKTVVALAAILKAVGAGYQSALMAPTEILAEQHYISIKRMLDELGIRSALLKSSLRKKQKDEVLAGIADGSVQIAVGTHALIQDGVNFNKLGLAVIDEQHRFGVMQRSMLADRVPCPHVLVMTATPIPRTLAMTVYGDLDYSVIKTMPVGRKPIVTKLFDDSSRAEAYKIMRRELADGRQAYVVFPLIDESEKSDLKAATEGAERVKEDFPGYTVGLVHGKLKTEEKDSVMAGFRDGSIRILVATTVIEVGVDVPNASVMLIEHAERFGLSQLHQLRGRVGRAGHQSFCILLPVGFSETSKQRMSAMLRSSDGFEIAEEDLKLRGPGEIIGTRQSGMPELTVGNIIRDERILKAARKEAFDIIAKDPGLSAPEHRKMKAALAFKWEGKLKLAVVG